MDVFTRRTSKNKATDVQSIELYACYPIVGTSMADVEQRLLQLESRGPWRRRWDGFGRRQCTVQSLPTVESARLTAQLGTTTTIFKFTILSFETTFSDKVRFMVVTDSKRDGR